jgi:hypothetical protein
MKKRMKDEGRPIPEFFWGRVKDGTSGFALRLTVVSLKMGIGETGVWG